MNCTIQLFSILRLRARRDLQGYLPNCIPRPLVFDELISSAAPSLSFRIIKKLKPYCSINIDAKASTMEHLKIHHILLSSRINYIQDASLVAQY